MLRRLDALRNWFEKLPWIALLLSALFLQAIYALPSHNLPKYQRPEASAKSGENKGAVEARVHNLAQRVPETANATNQDYNANKGGIWGWLVAFHDELIAIGTLVLGFFAFLQWVDSRRSSERQLRAYVLIDAIDIYDGSRIGFQATQPNTLSPEWTNYPVLEIRIRNSGKTPAKFVVHVAEIVISDAATEGNLLYPIVGVTQFSVIGPNTFVTKTLKLLPFPLSDPVLTEIREGTKGIYVYGRITYKDIFGISRNSIYRLRYAGVWPPIPSGTMTFCLAGNEAD